jgi:YVTN family beta-propeller protein
MSHAERSLRSRHHHRSLLAGALPALLASALAGGCGSTSNPGVDAGDDDDDDLVADASVDAGPTPVLARASKSGTIAISGDDTLVVMVNPENDSISIFDAITETLTEEVDTGDEPSAIVIHPDDDTAFVANRADATVVKVSGLRGTPSVSAPLAVGSEPTGLALSPTGARLYVAEWAEGQVSVIDTATMEIVGTIAAPQNPRAIAVTNDGDTDDDDELILVPEFYGEPTGREGTDTSRNARVRIYGASDLAPQTPIVFTPIDSGFTPPGGAASVMTSPNQLFSINPVGGKVYVTSIASSPAGAPQFQTNIQPVYLVGDLASRAEDRTGLGTTVLSQLVRDQIDDADPKFFLADLVDSAFVGETVSYVLARGADVLQRVVYDETDGVTIGSDFNKQIDLNVVPNGSDVPCQTPTGVVTAHAGPRAYVNCWVTRALGVVDLSQQQLTTTVSSADILASELAVKDGRRFYFTGRGRWSNSAWSSCGSCHPDGLSDNMTWTFGTGPRQTTSMDGSFSHGPGAQKQRIFNWTGVFDEIHDFERNTRGTSGGKGAITTAGAGSSCGDVANEVQVGLGGFLRESVKTKQDTTIGVCTDDWDKIEAFAKTIRPPRGRRFLDPEAVARGAALFGESTATASNASCVNCHGGAGWTVSRRFFVPSATQGDTLAGTDFDAPGPWPDDWNFHVAQVANQPANDVFDGPEATTAIGDEQVACVIRNVNTFGVPGDATETEALEKKPNGTRAQGRLGYNVPSLYGLQVGAPYLHHGGAASLEELFADPAWEDHLEAGSAVWLLAADVEEKKADLIQFLLSIDATTAEQDLPTEDSLVPFPAGHLECPPRRAAP